MNTLHYNSMKEARKKYMSNVIMILMYNFGDFIRKICNTYNNASYLNIIQ